MAEGAQPQWESVAFDATRETIRDRFGCSDEEAIARLQAFWNNGGEQRPLSPPAPPAPPAPPSSPYSNSNTIAVLFKEKGENSQLAG